MDITVKSLYLKSSPRKVRPVLMNLRGQNAEKALTSLYFTTRKGAQMMAAVLKSAIATARQNDLDIEKMYIKSVYCNDGPRLKRRQIGSRGRSDAILKRMCHINLVLSDKIETKEDKKTKPETKITNKEINKEEVKGTK